MDLRALALARRWELGALAALIAAFVALDAPAVPRESPTVDEPLHLMRGLSYWWTGDARLSYAHPPLANALTALPSARTRFFDPRTDGGAPREAWDAADNNAEARAAIAADYPTVRAALMRGRYVMVALAAAFLLYLWAFVRRWFGPRADSTGPRAGSRPPGPVAAVLAVAFLALDPTWLAHARLVTTDAPVTMAFVVAVGELIAYLDRPGWVRLATASLALGVALATKHSAALLVPTFLVIGGAAALLGRGRFAGATRGRALLRFAGHAAIATVTAALVVNAAYRFQRTGMTVGEILDAREPENAISRPMGGKLLEGTLVGKLPRGLRVPLPYAYVFGLATVDQFAANGRSSIFFGMKTREGFVAYFPTLLALKQPLVVVFLLALGVPALARARQAPRAAKIVGAVALALLAVAMASRLNLGVRHVLPIFPLLAVLAARVGARVWEERATRPWRFRAAAALGAASLAGTIATFPHDLGWFNALAGTSATAHRISIIGEDWAQDVGEAADRLRAKGVTQAWLQGYGMTSRQEMAFHGVETTSLGCKPPAEPGWIVAFASLYQRRRTSCFKFLTAPPDEVVNEHVYIWHWAGGGAPGEPRDDDADP